MIGKDLILVILFSVERRRLLLLLFDDTIFFIFLLCNLLSDLICQHKVVLLLFVSGKERDLFPDIDIFIGAIGVFVRVIGHKLQILVASIALEPGENAHWDIVSHILEYLLPTVYLRLKCENPLHALLYAHLAQCHCAPNSCE